ncbi:TetR/AcrR family transcriptional regulator [Mycobacterium pseudokansasii]|uniref:HTH-type transcriptional regulator BetI n=1 Tax=Mycobacterium pseudokansasii TaxID=2341080 RepID=A0A498R1B2_9MYCO|nr:TetR/AcrR family transcriptional regulator [Mycobacterium pseudokansasii]KZS64078.1 transcriptional regulator [Mycobacterium kansasii]VBA32634.1 HTH-type transcriptional regulator BetI [Mycobacterium pseudokansasii]VBA34309.1 HTH-type transcriptional regulator BetI [Mycobacterium pseudokansasii]VBA55736.1 HTH-type transcriptional regulator BetI [Mycobacterium pseudokansasii]
MPSTTTSRSSTTQRALLEAAVAEWAETGELEVAAVARRAGVSTGLPYRYFRTRSGLLIALVEDFYRRLGEAATLRNYDAPTWADRERQRIRDWLEFLYDEPLAPLVLGGPLGDGSVVAENTRLVGQLADVAARNIMHAQRLGELPADRDPQMLAVATLSGVHAMSILALSRKPRPPAAEVCEQVWLFVAGAVGLAAERNTKHEC